MLTPVRRQHSLYMAEVGCYSIVFNSRATAFCDLLATSLQRFHRNILPHTSVTEAGGQLLTAAFTFLGEMNSQREPTHDAGRMVR